VSNNIPVNNVNSYPTVEIMVKTGGELSISTEQHHQLNRVVRSTEYIDGFMLHLVLIPGDLYRLTSRSKPDLGDCFQVRYVEPSSKYVYVTEQRTLKQIDYVEEGKVQWQRLSFNRTLQGELYKDVVGTLTNGLNMIMLSSNEVFTIRDVSAVPDTHLGHGMLLYFASFEYDGDDLVITGVESVIREDVLVTLGYGIKEGMMLIRQHIKETACIQLAFNKKTHERDFRAVLKLLERSVHGIDIVNKANGFRVCTDIKTLVEGRNEKTTGASNQQVHPTTV
jgi:hypothetical protein